MSPRKSAAEEKLKPSPALAAILGSTAMVDRPTATKLVWQYIQKHGLQRLGYDKQIIVDDLLLGLLQHAHIAPKKPADFHRAVIAMHPLTEALNDNLSAP